MISGRTIPRLSQGVGNHQKIIARWGNHPEIIATVEHDRCTISMLSGVFQDAVQSDTHRDHHLEISDNYRTAPEDFAKCTWSFDATTTVSCFPRLA